MPQQRYRWSAPDGRKGRWRQSKVGAVISAVGMRHSNSGVRISVDLHVAAALWPGLADEGWKIEVEGKRKP